MKLNTSVIIITTLITHIPQFTAVRPVPTTVPVPLLVHRSDKNCLTIRHVLSVAASCVRIYSAGVIPSVDSTSGTVRAVLIVV
jgi:hypothetical protein